MKKIVLVFLSGLFIVSGVSSFLYAENKEQVELILQGIPRKDSRSLTERIGREIFEDFLRKHPHIKVRALSGIRLTNQLGMDSVIMSFAGGTAPDVLSIPLRNVTTFIEQGFIYPIDEYIDEWKKTTDVDSLHIPIVWKAVKQKGHIWGLPSGYSLNALIYRKDLFKKAGLDPNKPPKTWDEFYDYAVKLTDREKGVYGFGLFGQGGSFSWHWINFLWQAGGDIVEEDKDGNWKAVFNSKGGVEALKFAHKLLKGTFVKNGKQYTGVAKVVLWTLWDEFEAGKIAMVFSASRPGDMTIVPTDIDPNIVGLAPMPRGPTGLGGCEMSAGPLCISAATKDKRVRDAAWEYIKYMAGDDARKITLTRLIQAGYAKYINPEYLKKFGFEEYINEVPKEWVAMHKEMLSTSHLEPYGRNCQNIYGFMAPPLDKVILYDVVDYQKELDEAVAKTNEILIGNVPEKKMNHRRMVVSVVLVILAAVIGFFFVRYIKATMSSLKKEATNTSIAVKPGDKNKVFLGWLLMLPALITMLVWHYAPIFSGLLMAFQDYRVIGVSKWIGIDNFVSALYNDTFWIALKNTFVYAGLSLLIGFIAPIILALFLNEIPKGTVIYRICFYLPHVSSALVVLLLWKRFYDPAPDGLFNQVIGFFHIPPQLWLQDPKLAMICVIVIGVWSAVGAGSIFYLAALKMIPEELYEAADLDGANIMQKITHVTIPVLRPILIIMLVGSFVGSFQVSERILALTGGGPLNATHVLGLEVFYNAYVYLKFGYATAVAWMMGALLIGFTVQQLKIFRESKFKAGQTN